MGEKVVLSAGLAQSPKLQSLETKSQPIIEWRVERPFTMEAGSGRINIIHTKGTGTSTEKGSLVYYRSHWQVKKQLGVAWSESNI